MALLAGSALADVSAQWNGVELPHAVREGAWYKAELSGKMLAEGCWCDRKQLGNDCKERLQKRAPLAIKQYYRINQCLLTVYINGNLKHEFQVGLAGAATPALQERAMEEAAKAAQAIEDKKKAKSGKGTEAAPAPASKMPPEGIAPGSPIA